MATRAKELSDLGNSGHLNVHDDGTVTLEGGNVSIGTNSPSSPLHVRKVGNPHSGGNRNTVETVLTLDATGYYPYGGYGIGIDFKGEDYGNVAIREYAKIEAVMVGHANQTAAGDSAFTSALTFATNSGGASSTLATEKMRIDNDGNVGIGTDSPSAKLEIVDGNNKALLGDLNSNSTMSLRMSDASTQPVEVQAYSHSLKLRTTPSGGSITDRMVIDQNGNVGIGIDNPDRKLHVKSTSSSVVKFETSSSSYAGVELKNISGVADGSAAGYLYGYNSSQFLGGIKFVKKDSNSGQIVLRQQVNSTNTDVVNISDGNVGIGNVLPAHPIHIYEDGGYYASIGRGNSTPGGSDPWLGLFNNTDIANATFGWGIYDSNANGSFQIWNKNNNTTGYDALTILRGGNVGIGTDNPSHKLEVFGTANDGTELLHISSNGDVPDGGYHWMTTEIAGSQSTNANIVHMIGKELASKNSGYFGFHYAGDHSNDNFITIGGYAADQLLNIKMNGNVGIGTTSPATLLNVRAGTNHTNGTDRTDLVTLHQGISAWSVGRGAGIRWVGDVSRTMAGISTYVFGVEQTGLAFETGGATSTGNLNPTTRMVIDHNGNVGIGTNSPGAKLTITDENAGQPMLQVRNYSTSATGSFGNAHSVELRSATSTTTHGVLIHHHENAIGRRSLDVSDSNGIFASFVQGKVGIGTDSPSAKLHTKETTSDTVSAATAGVKFDGSGNDGLAFGNMQSSPWSSWIQAGYLADGYSPAFNNGYPISLNPVGGNVGIGITNPSEKLHVSGNILATGNVNASSDISLKDNITPIPNAIDKVLQIQGVTFNRNDIEDNPRQAGVIAQEVEKVLPEVVSEDKDGIKSVAYGNMVGLLIEAIKEQQEQINMLKEKLENK